MSSKVTSVAALFCAALVLVTCGDDDESPSRRAAEQRPAAETKPAGPPGPAQPLLARCGTDHFGPPDAARDARGWKITYQLRPGAQPRTAPAQTSVVTLLERSPTLPRGRLEGGRERVVEGRKVSFKDRTASTSYVAQWKTKRARYVAIVDGTSTLVLDRVIACMP